MKIKARLEKLRQLMKENGVAAYIIPSFDAHQSEYVAEHWKCREWISGFTGSAGTAVVTMEAAGLWTDGRYYIQAEKELKDSGISLFKMGQMETPTYIDWLKQVLSVGSRVGIDGKVFSLAVFNDMEKNFKRKNIKIETEFDLINEIWEDRPQIPESKIFVHEVKYAGKSRVEKLKEVRKEMKIKGANYYLLTSLDDIAWLLNIRGADVLNNPVVTSYVLISEEKADLFIDKTKVSIDIKSELFRDGVEVKDYEDIKTYLHKIKSEDAVLLDADKTSIGLYKAINALTSKIEDLNITTTLKAIKNTIEIENLKKCQIRDGVAMVKFIYWLKKAINKEKVTEISASDRVEKLRSEQELFMGTSFDSIAGYKENAAMMHYKPMPETTATLKNEGFFLLDSGGQYLDGTTDITRTIVLGDISDEEKTDFTLVLKGHIGLSSAKFLYGATGANLDVLARKPLWDVGIDYKCGTGHGVGFFLNVHEGPQNISQKVNTVRLEEGMIITNEPGIYKEGKHGIRTENVVLVIKDEKTEFGQFMKFDTISFCPVDLNGINEEMLTVQEKDWLNKYHREVFNKLSPYLKEEEKAWLEKETREI